MKLALVFNSKGNIVAAARIDVDSKVPLPRPIATKKLKALEIEVPIEYCHEDLGTVCQCLRVDAKRKMLVPIRAKKTPKASTRLRQ
ncbi:MAG TPA: hypothetical protein VLE46_00665 [Nitrospira sp.]|nr:hypothetical protein [Nitrospira sp.]